MSNCWEVCFTRTIYHRSIYHWYTANVTDLIEAIPDVGGLSGAAFTTNAQAIVDQMQDIISKQATVIKNLTRMVLAIRDKVFPNLGDK